MKKVIVILISVAIIAGVGVWWYNTKKDNNNSSESRPNYQAERSSTNTNTNMNNVNNSTKTTNTSNDQNTQNIQNSAPKAEETKTETEIASFTTKIHNKDEERQNNMSITCNTLTNKEVKPGETFSFCDTVGKSTSSKGYQKADIFVDGKKKQGLGGGNCQVSTTLYNAITKIPELEVTERHQHSAHVPYIQDGKDAAVSYGAYDLKFKNNLGSTIKIVMEKTADNVTAKILKIG